MSDETVDKLAALYPDFQLDIPMKVTAIRSNLRKSNSVGNGEEVVPLRRMLNDALYSAGEKAFQEGNIAFYAKCVDELRSRASPKAAKVLAELEQDAKRWRLETHAKDGKKSAEGHVLYREAEIVPAWVDLIARATESIVISTFTCELTEECPVFMTLRDALNKTRSSGNRFSMWLIVDGRVKKGRRREL